MQIQNKVDETKEVLYKCLYGQPTYNKLYLDELIEYFHLQKEND